MESLVTEHEHADDEPDTFEQLCIERERHEIHLTHLKAERDQAQFDIEALQNILSPIRRIPVEILSEIFVRCLSKDGLTRPSSGEAPLLLMMICRRWRDVAISTPKLWSSLSILLTERCHPHLSLIQTFLSRSAPLPFSFLIEENAEYLPSQPITHPWTPRVFELLLQHFSRWKDISIHYKDWRVDDSLLQVLHEYGSPSSLETVSMKREWWSSQARDSISRLFSSTRLRSISWRGLVSGVNNVADLMPLESLRELRLDNILTTAQFTQTLLRATHLVSCQLSVYCAPITSTVDSVQSLTDPVTTFLDLTSLELVTNIVDEQIFDLLTLPSLNSLSISRLNDLTVTADDVPPRFWSMAPFRALHQRSNFTLTFLQLVDVPIQSSQMLEILRLCCTSLHHLSISSDHTNTTCIDDTILQLLTLTPGPEQAEEILCPRLKHLSLLSCTQSVDGLVSDMLRSRWGKNNKNSDSRDNLLNDAMIMFKNDGSPHTMDYESLKALNGVRGGITVIKSHV